MVACADAQRSVDTHRPRHRLSAQLLRGARHRRAMRSQGNAMSRSPRFLPENKDGVLVEVSSRTVNVWALMRPCAELSDVTVGVLGRSLEISPVEIVAICCMSNHYHALLVGNTGLRLVHFHRFCMVHHRRPGDEKLAFARINDTPPPGSLRDPCKPRFNALFYISPGRRRKSPSWRSTKRPWVSCVCSKARQVAPPASAPLRDPLSRFAPLFGPSGRFKGLSGGSKYPPTPQLDH